MFEKRLTNKEQEWYKYFADKGLTFIFPRTGLTSIAKVIYSSDKILELDFDLIYVLNQSISRTDIHLEDFIKNIKLHYIASVLGDLLCHGMAYDTYTDLMPMDTFSVHIIGGCLEQTSNIYDVISFDIESDKFRIHHNNLTILPNNQDIFLNNENEVIDYYLNIYKNGLQG